MTIQNYSEYFTNEDLNGSFGLKKNSVNHDRFYQTFFEQNYAILYLKIYFMINSIQSTNCRTVRLQAIQIVK